MRVPALSKPIPVPSTWRSRTQGTRHVVDRTLGGDVVYIQGRRPAEPWRGYCHKFCKPWEWTAYASHARQIR